MKSDEKVVGGAVAATSATGGRRAWARGAWVGVAGLLAGLCGACTKTQADAGPARGGAAPAAPVKVAQALLRDVPVQIRAIARVEPYATVTVKPQVAGQIVGVNFVEGQDVKKGDLLYTLDARPFEAALRQAEGTLAKDTALSKDADEEAARETGLFQQGVATQREYDTARFAAESLKAAVQADTATVEMARLQLAYCQIHAPIDGRTGSRLADQGTIVKENETNLVIINQINPIYVTFAVPERYLPQIKEFRAAGALRVEATLPPDQTEPETGTLTFVDNQVDRTTGTITLKGTFANEQRRLWPGQFVNAALTLTTRVGAVVVPTAAVQTGQSGQFVFVVKKDRTAELRPITAGLAAEEQTVVDQGLSAGETVVTDGQLRLVNGAKVEIKGDSDRGAAGSTPASGPTSQP